MQYLDFLTSALVRVDTGPRLGVWTGTKTGVRSDLNLFFKLSEKFLAIVISLSETPKPDRQ